LNGPIPICKQDVANERRFVYDGETGSGPPLAAIATERGETIGVVTADDLEAGQRREYSERRVKGE